MYNPYDENNNGYTPNNEGGHDFSNTNGNSAESNSYTANSSSDNYNYSSSFDSNNNTTTSGYNGSSTNGANNANSYYNSQQSGWHIPNNDTSYTEATAAQQETERPYTVDFQMVDNTPSASGAAVKKNHKGLKITALILAGMILAFASGFGGAMAAQGLNGSNSNGGSSTVLTKSIVNTSNTAGSTTSTAEVVEAVSDSVVEITTEVVQTNQFLQQYVSEGAGSGVIISEDGYIVTNNHVIEGASSIQVRTKDGETYQASLVGTDAENDIAVVKIDDSGLSAAVIGDSDSLVVGEDAVAIGNPLGSLGGTVTRGIVSALDREITIDGNTMHLLQIDAAINPGNSGGGLFNSSGELVGIVNAKSSASGIEGLGFAIPINTAMDIATDLIENGYVTGKVKLGVTLLAIEDEQTAMQYGVSKTGVYIKQVEANSDAYYAGLRAGDLIDSINGQKITSTDEVKSAIESSSVGDTLEIKIYRGNKEQTVQVTLTEYNSTAAAFQG